MSRIAALLSFSLCGPLMAQIASRALVANTDQRIALYEKLTAANPANAANQEQLAEAYLQKTRETTDFSYLDRAEKIVARILESQPGDYDAMRLRNLIELNRHHFDRVITNAGDMAKLDPDDALNWGTLGDALMETGRVEEAKTAYEKMLSLRPGLFSYNRIAYYRWVTGDTAGALEAINLAVASPRALPENRAWCLVELGGMNFKLGRLEEARQAYDSALKLFPLMHSAWAGLGAVQAARGKVEEAIASYRKAQANVPMFQYAAALSDLYETAGNQAEARKQRGLLDVSDRLERAANQTANRGLALALANQDRALPRAMELARADLDVRKDIYTYDAFGWVLYKTGKIPEASRAAGAALSRGAAEPLLYYHAGMIAHAAGDDESARKHLSRALELNPKFDLIQSRIARETLEAIAKLPSRAN